MVTQSANNHHLASSAKPTETESINSIERIIIYMPGISFHVKRSISPPATAKRIHEALDNIHTLPFFTKEVHGKWRKLTHNVPVAAFIGYKLGGRDGMIDALNHIKDDLLYNKLFYERDKQREQEREVAAMMEEVEAGEESGS